MKLPEPEVICSIVRKAAKAELLPRFADVTRDRKRDGSIVTVADRAMQDNLEFELKQRWPEFRLLGEEMSEARQAELLAAPGAGIWIVDPLDGTSNFAAGIPFYSVSVALMVGGRSVLGVVYDPARDECFSATETGSAHLNGQPLKDLAAAPDSLKQCIATVDFKRLPASLLLRLVDAPPYSSQRSFGSVALDWCWAAAGRFHLYLHGRQKIWDYAAGHLIMERMGGHSCGLDGGPVFLASGEPRSALAALDQDIFHQWREWILLKQYSSDRSAGSLI
ncbi:MAG: inositol monophosphatase family protein [Gammaproteobacteria bacterium]|nr:inositol monophosphatase family protein [Gammaproteobacteria bacterium]